MSRSSYAPNLYTAHTPSTVDDSEILQVETLSSDTFAFPSTLAQRISQWWKKDDALTGRVTCSVPFTSTDGRAFLAVACAEGVWIGFRHDPRTLRRVLHLKMVTQCAALEEFGILLVLANKSLFAYDLEALVPSSPQSAKRSHPPQKLSQSNEVQFFRIGRLEGQPIVVYAKKKGSNSVFRVLEPTVDKIREGGMTPAALSSRLGQLQSRSKWFRVIRDFLLPSEAYDVIFLGTRIAIPCKNGFEIVELSNFRCLTVPRCDDPRQKKLAKRCRSCHPMGMFHSRKDEFLLCYDKFGLYVDARGEPVPTRDIIEWGCTAEHVAWYPPYVLIFSSRSIEVRHVGTGRLCHIIRGHGLQCTWDGFQSFGAPLVSEPDGIWGKTPAEGAHVHGVMLVDDESQERSGLSRTVGGVAHRVFELVPTIPTSRFEEPWTPP
ncbi:CNH domain-containing protein [Russula earlei]|uniref:CNH domain-containing protein n=1 Tax=Russula earlei TaxID=71964 RepID=A0ACC0UNJ6_9AGAM|nr:CNH domain-containing protein [Russula earlei]